MFVYIKIRQQNLNAKQFIVALLVDMQLFNDQSCYVLPLLLIVHPFLFWK